MRGDVSALARYADRRGMSRHMFGVSNGYWAWRFPQSELEGMLNEARRLGLEPMRRRQAADGFWPHDYDIMDDRQWVGRIQPNYGRRDGSYHIAFRTRDMPLGWRWDYVVAELAGPYEFDLGEPRWEVDEYRQGTANEIQVAAGQIPVYVSKVREVVVTFPEGYGKVHIHPIVTEIVTIQDYPQTRKAELFSFYVMAEPGEGIGAESIDEPTTKLVMTERRQAPKATPQMFLVDAIMELM